MCSSDLKTLGDWPTFYEGLSSLPQHAQQSWFAFDHYYSDQAFPAALPLVFADKPKRLLDVGGNTGRWAVQCLKHNPDVRITIADLPHQLDFARATMKQHGFESRVEFCGVNMLDEKQPLPTGHDAIWMSQFLDCFSEAQIVSILRRAAAALNGGGTLHILELFWDRQPDSPRFLLNLLPFYTGPHRHLPHLHRYRVPDSRYILQHLLHQRNYHPCQQYHLHLYLFPVLQVLALLSHCF